MPPPIARATRAPSAPVQEDLARAAARGVSAGWLSEVARPPAVEIHVGVPDTAAADGGQLARVTPFVERSKARELRVEVELTSFPPELGL